jgi:hypothetical protein
MDPFSVLWVVVVWVEVPGCWDFGISPPFGYVARGGWSEIEVVLDNLQLFLYGLISVCKHAGWAEEVFL